MSRNEYKHRSWNVICDRCGSKYKAHQVATEWTGLLVCRGPGTKNCYDHRNPQDFVRSRKDTQKVPYTRPEPTPTYINEVAGDCSICHSQAIAGIGTAGCMVAGLNSNLGTLCTDDNEDTP